MPRINPREAGGANVAAFLDMTRVSEIGPEMMAASDSGYNVLVGSLPGKLKLFHDYSHHPLPPGMAIEYSPGLWSTAAGGYQILSRYWKHYQNLLGLHDFGPVNQDRYAIHMFKERGALDDIKAGLIRDAIARCSNTWASFPGAGYGQHEHQIETLIDAYINAGGSLHSDEKDWFDRVVKV
ncbi:glycoside hydrolase family 24 protein [Modicisalibacter coralii]|uniref:glycoside hydrolase family 24 protein n=1 Tax=Modicisalibacter coralii TaxID=2304602 RepID=UPI00100B25CF|nr:glycoside hydrolase family 104 protein [Halomonas coralii]